MQTALASTEPREATPGTAVGLSSGFALILAAWFGLVGGYLDLGSIFVKRDLFHASVYYELGRHFRWTVPVANLAILMLAGLLVAGAIRLRPRLISWRFGVFVFATLAIWGPMLRAPFYGVASLFVAIGSARLLSRWICATPRGSGGSPATAWLRS